MSSSPASAGGSVTATARAVASRARRPRWRVLDLTVALVAFVGAWISLDLWRISLGVSASNPLLSSVCDPRAAAASDCSSVLASTWGTFPLGTAPNSPRVPLAAMGMAYFCAVGAWFLFVGRVDGRRWTWYLPIFTLILLGAYQSYYSVDVMATVLQRWCVGCVAVHACNALIALLALAAFPWRRGGPRDDEPYPQRRLAGATLLLGFASLLFFPTFALLLSMNNVTTQMQQLYESVVNDPAYLRMKIADQPVLDIPIGDAPPDYGIVAAPVTIVAFVDFECERCKQLRSVLKDLVARSPDRFRVYYRHFPLDRACNPHSDRTVHASACLAARAYEAARQLGGARAASTLRGMFYNAQREIAPGAVDDWAATIAVDRKAFRNAISSSAIEQRIAADIELAKKLGVNAVPFVFVDGKRFDFWRNPAAWQILLGDSPQSVKP